MYKQKMTFKTRNSTKFTKKTKTKINRALKMSQEFYLF